MTLQEQAYAQALLLAGDLTEYQTTMLNALCISNYTALEARLRDGITAEDCKVDLVSAVSLLALADLGCVGDEELVEQITAGDFTIRKKSGDAASNCLRAQAELIIAPYLKDRFCFQGV
ncbi:MAG: hypothetical protein J6J18_05545 [Oscillospiraceae bacterium]|nr:hypothetical protein [Oscillospiraceae bacterium]